MGMTVRNLRFPVLLVCLFGLLGSVGTAHGQTVLVSAKSLAELTDDLEYLVKSVAPEDNQAAQTALAVLGQFKSGAMVKGLDKGRSFGLAITLPKEFPQGDPPSVVAAVPVTDLGQFLDSLKDFGLAVDDQPGVAGFSHKVTAPNGSPTLFVLKSKGYALFSLVPDGADRLKVLDPASWKPKGRPETAIGVKVRLSELPDALKDQFLNQVEANVDQQNDRHPGEGDAQYKGRIAGQKFSLEAIKSLIRDGDEVSFDLDLDRKASELSLELAMHALPNTAMAKTLRTLNDRRSHFQALGKDAAMAAWASFPMAKDLRDLVSGLVEKGIKDSLSGFNSEEDKKFQLRFGELLKTALNAPEIDLGLAIQVPSAEKAASQIVLLGGLRVPNGREFERLFRDAAAQKRLGDNVTMTFDAAKAADGTAIHQMTGPIDEKNPEMSKRFGKASLFLAFRQDAILASFGEAGLEPLRQAIERSSGPAAPASAEPLAAVIHVANLGKIAEQGTLLRATSEVFPAGGAKRDRIAFGLKGEGDGIRLRLAIDVTALKLMVVASGLGRN
jgi:hypothetical protein